MRKPSPISTSWPRETTTSRPAASALSDEHQRGGVVGHREPGLGTRQLRDQRRHGVLARPAPARRQVDLEVRVAAGDGGRCGQRLGRQRRPAEVRVDDHAGGVQHPAEVRRLPRQRLLGDRRRVGFAVAGRRPGAAAFVEPAAHRRDRHVPARAGRELLRRRLAEDPVDRRQAAEVRHGRSVWFAPCSTGSSRPCSWRCMARPPRRRRRRSIHRPAPPALIYPTEVSRPAPSSRRCRRSPTCPSNLADGSVIYGRRPHEKRPIASLTKMMTGILTAEQGNLRGEGARPGGGDEGRAEQATTSAPAGTTRAGCCSTRP